MIRVNLSLNEEMKLSECENAWQASTMANKTQDPAGGSDNLEDTVKKVRVVLNNMTPENCDVLLKTMTSISLDSSEKMQSVMILAIEKTISEPNFIQTYAKFWQVLLQEVKPENKAYFTTLLIKRIQTEFEDNVNTADAKKNTLQPLVDKLKTSTDLQERQEIETEIEEKEYQFRRRSLGTVRFIGEMYKLKQLTSDRIMMYVESLQDHGSEEKLEYMCILLTTVGHLIDRLDKVFIKINETVKNKGPNSSGKNSNKITISSRVRFMMQGVIDLRHRHWDQRQSHGTTSTASVNSDSFNPDRSNCQRKNHLHRNSAGDSYFAKNSTKIQDSAGGSDSVEDTVNKVRGVLNKLTPENCEVLLKTMTSIPLDSLEKIQSVMILTFEKTINEPNFVQTYPIFWNFLLHEVNPEFKAHFTMLLIKRIQTEFEDNVNTVDAKKNTLQPLVDQLKTSTDPQERQEIEDEIEENEFLFRRRCLGTVRFIGEMYKLKKLTPDRVMMCIESLQDHGSEEQMEYMCELLTTVGHHLIDTKSKHFVGRDRLDKVFIKINETVNNSRPNSSSKNSNKIIISSRVRLMMQDLIYLRLILWDQTPSHGSFNSERGGSGISSQHKQRGRNQFKNNNRTNYDRDVSSQRMAYNRSNSQRQNRLDRDKALKNSQKFNFQQDDKVIDLKKFSFSKCEDPSLDTQLVNSLMYNWRLCGKSSVGPMHDAGNNSTSVNNNVNRQTKTFHALSTKDSDAERPSAFLTSATSSSNEKSESEEKSITANAPKDYRKQITSFVEEFLDCARTNIFDWQSNALSTWRSNTLDQQLELIYYLLTEYLHLRQVTTVERSACAAVFSYLLLTEAFDKKTFGKAYDQFAEEFPDVMLDVPAGWAYIFEFLGLLLHDRFLSFEDIWRDFWKDDKVFTKRFVKAFVVHFTKEFGANYIRNLWHKEYKLDRGQMFITDQKERSDFFDSQELKLLFDNNVIPMVKLSTSLTSARSSSNEKSESEEKSITTNAPKDYRKQITSFVEEFLDCARTNIFDWQSNALSTWRSNTLEQQLELIYCLLIDYLHLSQVTTVERSACAAVFSYLLRTEAFDKKTFGKAYEYFAEEFPDVVLDVPAGWAYIFEFLGLLLHDRFLSFEDIWRDFWKDDKVFTKRFVKAFVVHFTKEFGANYIRNLWHKEYKLDRGQMFITDQKERSDFFDSQELKFLFDDNVIPMIKLSTSLTSASSSSFSTTDD